MLKKDLKARRWKTADENALISEKKYFIGLVYDILYYFLRFNIDNFVDECCMLKFFLKGVFEMFSFVIRFVMNNSTWKTASFKTLNHKF